MFELLFAEIVEGQIKPVANLVIDVPGDADAAGLGNRFEPGGDVDALPVDVLAVVDYIAEIDTHAEVEWARRQAILDDYGTLDGVLDRRELGQKTIARMLNNASGMLGDGRIDGLRAGGLPGDDGTVCVLFDKPRVARDIGGKDRR